MCVFVYVCVCVFLCPSTVEASSVCNDSVDILEGTKQRSYVVGMILYGSSSFPYLIF